MTGIEAKIDAIIDVVAELAKKVADIEKGMSELSRNNDETADELVEVQEGLRRVRLNLIMTSHELWLENKGEEL